MSKEEILQSSGFRRWQLDLLDMEIRGGSARVAYVLWWYPQVNRFDPNIPQLMQETHATRKTVKRALEELREHGLLLEMPSPTPKARHLVYRLDLVIAGVES